MAMLRALLVAGSAILPAGRLKNRLLRALGWKVASGARIYPCLVVNVTRVEIGPNARIGSMTVIRDLNLLALREFATIGQWNWISAARPLAEAGAPAELHIGAHSALTSRHYVDCSGGVTIGEFSTVAGVRSTFITHGIRWKDAMQSYKPIKIGDYCLISSNVQLAPGANVGDRVIVGMGATIAGSLEGPGLYIQERALRVSDSVDGSYFSRKEGRISAVHTADVAAHTNMRIDASTQSETER